MKSKCVIVYGKLLQHRGGAHVKNDRPKILNDYFSANEIFEENFFFYKWKSFSIPSMYLHYFVFSLENIDVVKAMCCVS